MERLNPRPQPGERATNRRSLWLGLLAAGAGLVVLLTLLVPRPAPAPNPSSPAATLNARTGAGGLGSSGAGELTRRSRGSAGATPTPEETVAAKVVQFTRDRLQITRAMAQRSNVPVAKDVERFFEIPREAEPSSRAPYPLFSAVLNACPLAAASGGSRSRPLGWEFN